MTDKDQKRLWRRDRVAWGADVQPECTPDTDPQSSGTNFNCNRCRKANKVGQRSFTNHLEDPPEGPLLSGCQDVWEKPAHVKSYEGSKARNLIFFVIVGIQLVTRQCKG